MQYWKGQKVLGTTVLFGKDYVWMEDPEGKVYLVRVIDGVPQI